MKIQERDKDLVMAFLQREAMDFGRSTREWAEELQKKVEEGLKSYHKGADYLVINSYSNMGLLNRSLTLTPSPWKQGKIVTIDLCTCGSLNCWGTIEFPDKMYGKKGVIPFKRT